LKTNQVKSILGSYY